MQKSVTRSKATADDFRIVPSRVSRTEIGPGSVAVCEPIATLGQSAAVHEQWGRVGRSPGEMGMITISPVIEPEDVTTDNIRRYIFELGCWSATDEMYCRHKIVLFITLEIIITDTISVFNRYRLYLLRFRDRLFT